MADHDNNHAMNDNIDNEHHNHDYLLEHELLPALIEMALAGNYDPSTSIDRDKALLLLEVTDANVELAAQLYWDDFLVTRQQEEEQEEPRPLPRQEQEQQQGNDESEDDQEDDDIEEADDDNNNNNNNNNDAPARPVMELLPDDEEDYVQRLDGLFERAHRNELHVRRPPLGRPLPLAGNGGGNNNNDDYVAAAQRFVARARRLLAGHDDDDDDDDDDSESAPGQEAPVPVVAAQAAAVARRLLDQPQLLRQQQQEEEEQAQETVSVSDDEAGGGVVRNRLARAHLLTRAGGSSQATKKRSASDPLASPRNKRLKQLEEVDDRDEDDIETYGYLCENDWIWDTLHSPRRAISLTAPTDLLWGLPSEKIEPASINEAEDDDEEDDEDASDDEHGRQGENLDNRRARPAGNVNARNVIAADDGDEVSSNNEGDSTDQVTGIPTTWLNARFQLDKEATGVAILSPNEDDIGFYAWQAQQTSAGGRSPAPPPYHCRALTSIASIVTALLHTGVFAHNRHISQGWRKPFLELEKDDRKREFQDRLADALTCLLEIAANASLKRKEIALRRLKEEALAAIKHNDEDDNVAKQAEKLKWKMLEDRLQLCPTCIWDRDPEVRVMGSRTTSRNVLLTTSYTNINELRSFVIAQMNHFTASGGVALFLENVVRFHGRDTIDKMISLARQTDHSSDHGCCLVHCTCEEMFFKKLEQSTTAAAVRANFPNIEDTSPPGHACFSIELLSLLLTGRIHTTLEGWSTGPLSFGVLTGATEKVCKALTRPAKPVWVLRGPTCYSAMWANNMNNCVDSFDPRFDRPGSVAKVTHWNPWYTQRRKTDFRMVVGRERTALPVADTKLSSVTDEEGDESMTDCKTVRLITKRQKLEKAVLNELVGSEPVDHSLIITSEVLDRIIANPDDQKYYPKKYKSWRYDIDDEDDAIMDRDDKKPRIIVWKPYHRLTDREKMLVEALLGPKIKTILWSRWPKATIDSFEPADPPPIV